MVLVGFGRYRERLGFMLSQFFGSGRINVVSEKKRGSPSSY